MRVPTSTNVLQGFISPLNMYRFPLVGLVQVRGCNERQGHVDHVLFSTARGLVDQAAHWGSTDVILQLKFMLFSYTYFHSQ